MTMIKTIAPPNSLLLIMDPSSSEIPESMEKRLVAATPSCIAIGTRSAADGETTVTLTDDRAFAVADKGLRQVFNGSLSTPQKEIAVCTVDLTQILRLDVSRTFVVVEIWADDSAEPAKLCVLVDGEP